MPESKQRAPEATTKNVIVGTAGHIDHGKSALVEALTGTHPDRLEEERRRGITIDLGFAFLELGKVRLGFVDVPGHERFVRNMLAGAGGIDLLLLVIAADEGIKPQTREHFDICRLLGISRGIVVLTKSDLAEPTARDIVKIEVEDFLRGSFLVNAPIVTVSARTGEGMGELRETLTRVAAEVPEKNVQRYFRLPIDRAFAMKGFGTVVTGTLVSGQVSKEDEVELHPSRRLLRIRGIQSGGRSVDRAGAGQRTALNLAGIDLEDVRRGMVLSAPGHFAATKHLDARIDLLSTPRPLKSGARVHFHQGAAHTVARVTLLEGTQILPGSSVIAHLVLQEQVFLLPGDRFIIRQFSPVVTIGGGTVLQTLRRRRVRDPETLKLLATIETGDRENILLAMIEAAPEGLSLENVIARTVWLKEEVAAAADALEKLGALQVLRREPVTFGSASRVKDCAARVRECITQFHRAKSLAEGMPKEDLRAQASGDAGPDIFQAALGKLMTAGELVISGDTVKRAGRAVTLNPEEMRYRQGIEAAYLKSGLMSPTPAEVIAKLGLEPGKAQSLIQLLIREKVLVKIAEGMVFHMNALAQLRQALVKYKHQHGPRLSVAGFKELTGVTRKYAIPLLENLDRTGITRREGDERVIL